MADDDGLEVNGDSHAHASATREIKEMLQLTIDVCTLLSRMMPLILSRGGPVT